MNNNEIFEEYGSVQKFKIASQENLEDDLICSCGKKAMISIFGKESFSHMCSECMDKLHG